MVSRPRLRWHLQRQVLFRLAEFQVVLGDIAEGQFVGVAALSLGQVLLELVLDVVLADGAG